MEITDLPAVNAALNGLSALLLSAGFVLVRRRRLVAHQRVMLAAVATSALFLVSYLIYHASVGSVKFQGTGAVRAVYFTILLTHTILAAAIVPMVILTLLAALKNRLPRHKKLARWTLPLWLYVSVTGVVIYWMLYQCEFA